MPDRRTAWRHLAGATVLMLAATWATQAAVSPWTRLAGGLLVIPWALDAAWRLGRLLAVPW